MTVQQIMIRQVITVEMDEHLLALRDVFLQHNCHHLMVVDARRLVGVVSDRDLLRNISPFVDGISERTANHQPFSHPSV